MPEPAQDIEPFLTVDDLAKMLRISANVVRRRCQTDMWPHLEMPYRQTYRYLFTPEHVDLIVQSMTPTPVLTIRRPRRNTATRKRATSSKRTGK